jgi:hypothetical protein
MVVGWDKNGGSPPPHYIPLRRLGEGYLILEWRGFTSLADSIAAMNAQFGHGAAVLKEALDSSVMHRACKSRAYCEAPRRTADHRETHRRSVATSYARRTEQILSIVSFTDSLFRVFTIIRFVEFRGDWTVAHYSEIKNKNGFSARRTSGSLLLHHLSALADWGIERQLPICLEV